MYPKIDTLIPLFLKLSLMMLLFIHTSCGGEGCDDGAGAVGAGGRVPLV